MSETKKYRELRGRVEHLNAYHEPVCAATESMNGAALRMTAC